MTSQAAVPASDVTLQAPIRDNLTVVAPFIGYGQSSALTAQVPLFTPWNAGDPLWWDNLVQELLQGRISVVNLNNRGWATPSGTPIPTSGNMDPRRLSNFFAAATRAGVPNYFKAICFIDTAGIKTLTNAYHGYPYSQPIDMGVQSDWSEIWFTRFIEPWFDTVPSSAWYRINGRPVIHIWSANYHTNQLGNEAPLLQSLEQQFTAKYGVAPVFMLDQSWWPRDPGVAQVTSVIANNPWFSTTTGYNMTNYNGYICGTFFAGYGSVKARDSGATLRAGLDASFNNKAHLMYYEGWTNQVEQMGVYRSKDAAWDFPNQYIDILQGFNDFRTVTLRLEAEGADAYSDTSAGNSGASFRSDDLDVRTIAGTNAGWAVGWTAPSEWIEFKGVNFSPGNYKFPIRYAAPSAGKRVRLLVDGVALPEIALPATGATSTFDTIYLGQKTMTGGAHTLRIEFVDGGVDLDWLFIKKFDPMISLRSTNNSYVCAELGGGSLIRANRASVGVWERFSADDINGGSLNDGDTVYLQTHNGLFLSASGGGGAALTSDKRVGAGDEKFTIRLVSGSAGSIVSGYTIALQSRTGKYLTVGANSTLDVTGSSIGSAQTFTVGIGTQ